MIVMGTLLEIERKSGNFTPDGSTEPMQYDYTLLHVLEGHQVRKVRLPKGIHTSPWQRGEDVEVEVSVADNIKITALERSLVPAK